MEYEIAEVVREHGWYAANIADANPPFLYSIGLIDTFRHPEFIIFGLESDDAHALLSQLVRDIDAGRSYSEPGISSVVIADHAHRVGFRRVHVTQHPLYLGFAMGYCRHIGRTDDLKAMQVFWPDGGGKFPFEAGCDPAVDRVQPRLDIALSPREIREWQRQWE